MYAGGANFMSLLFMNVYRIYILLVWFDFAPLLMIDKKRENDFEFIYAYLDIEFMHVLYFMFIQKGGEGFWKFIQKKERRFSGRRILDFRMFLSPCLCIYICLVLCTSLNIYLFIVMHELRGSLNFNPVSYTHLTLPTIYSV